ncbi:MAG: SNF2-related protein [Planctomycetaceae bacterium]
MLPSASWSPTAGRFGADDKQIRQPLDLKFRVQSGIDWFELHADVNFDGRTISFPELLSALQRGESTVVLDDGSLGIVPEDWIRRYGMLAGLGVTEGDHLRFSAVQAGIFDAMLMTQGTVDYDEKFNETRQRLAKFSGVASVQEPAEFHGELRPHQRQGLGWLQFLDEFDFGGCLADDMGLGKTIQILAHLEMRKRRMPDHRPSLVVVPKSLLFNWVQECRKFTPDLNVMEYAGLDRARLRQGVSQAGFDRHHLWDAAA